MTIETEVRHVGNWKPRLVAALLAALLALYVEGHWPLLWWHSYCDNPTEGNAYALEGFPFPYLEPGVNSMDFDFLPLIYALNLALLMVAFYPILALAVRRLNSFGMQGVNIVSAMGLMLFLWFAAEAGWLAYFAYRPVDIRTFGLGQNAGDYFTYRPNILAGWLGHRPCKYYGGHTVRLL